MVLGLVGWEGIAEVVEALCLSPGDTLLDLACGRGGYGLEIAARTGARLVGIDFSSEAVRQAREHAQRLGRVADFRTGDLAATGLDAGTMMPCCALTLSSSPSSQTLPTAN